MNDFQKKERFDKLFVAIVVILLILIIAGPFLWKAISNFISHIGALK